MYFFLLEDDLETEIHPQGSSRSSGGIFRGRAIGNVVNLADPLPDLDVEMLPVMGQVRYFFSAANPSSLTDMEQMNPSGSFQHTKVKTVAPILRQLARRYPPVETVKGMFHGVYFFLD